MKTAVSLPDDLFHGAERMARRLRISRSELYARAIEEFLSNRSGAAVTEQLDRVYSRVPAKLDAALDAAQLKSLPEDGW